MIHLYDFPLSPYARKVRLALYEKGLAFEKHEIYRKSQRKELFDVNPRGEVPALVDDGLVIYDSAVICAYLEDRYPDVPLLPADPAERARCRRIEKISDGVVDVADVFSFLIKLFRQDLAEQFPDLPGKVSALVNDVYDFLDHELAGRKFIAGDAFSIAEAALLPRLTSTVFLGYAIDESRPHLFAWYQHVSERPSVKRDLADTFAAFEIARNIQDPMFDSHHLQWRDQRIEGLIQVGLGPWLLDELEKGRAFLPPRLSAA